MKDASAAIREMDSGIARAVYRRAAGVFNFRGFNNGLRGGYL